MARPPSSFDACKRFYQEGGYVKRKETAKEREQRIKMALYGSSQWDRPAMAGGGKVAKAVGEGLTSGSRYMLELAKRAVDSPQFQRWFGDSKMVDKAGLPEPVFHASPWSFDKFRAPTEELGIHVGDAPTAREYAMHHMPDIEPLETFDAGDHFGAPQTYPLFARAEKSVRLPDIGSWYAPDVHNALREQFERVPPMPTRDKAIDWLRNKGFDSAVYRNEVEVPDSATLRNALNDAYETKDQRLIKAATDALVNYRRTAGTDSHILFDPTQLKSVFNTGEWGGDNPDIMRAGGGKVDGPFSPMPRRGFAYGDGGRVGFAKGSSAISKYMRELGKFIDPAAEKINDWAWRPLQQVAGDLGLTGPTTFSPEVQNYADFMRKMSTKASLEGLSPEDLMKSYALTRMSMGRSAINPEPLIQKGLEVPSGEMIRPEGAMAYWLRTPAGRQYLEEAAHTGKVDPKIGSDLTGLFTSFGKQNEMPDILNWGAANLPGKEGRISELVARASTDQSSPGEWLDSVGRTRGILPSKQGFWASLLGRGDMPTFDARQIILNTGLPSAEGSARVGTNAKAVEAVNRLRGRMEGLDYQGPDWMKPYYPHLAHHETWDRAAGEATTHQDLIDTMLGNYAGGGRVGYATGAGVAKTAGKIFKTLGDYAYELVPEQNLIESIAKQTGHSVDEVLNAVRSKTAGIRDDLATFTGWSTRKGKDSIYDQSTGLIVPEAYERYRFSPEDLYGPDNYGVFGMSDRTRGGARIKALDGTMLDRQMTALGGSDFPYTQRPGRIWASDQGALSGLTNAVLSPEEEMIQKLRINANKDSNVFYLNKIMGSQAGDQSYQSLDLATQMLEKARMTADQRKAFDEKLMPWNYGVAGKTINMYPDWIGSDKPASEMLEYLNKRVMGMRSPFMKFLDLKGVQDLGAPNPATIRMAVTDPALFFAPEGSAGRTVSKIDLHNPFAREGTHPDYPVNLLGTHLGTMDKPLPPGLAAPDWWKNVRKADPNNPSSDDMSSWRTTPVVQRFDQEWLDTIMPQWERLKPWTRSGLARGGRVFADEPSPTHQLYHTSQWQDAWDLP